MPNNTPNYGNSGQPDPNVQTDPVQPTPGAGNSNVGGGNPNQNNIDWEQRYKSSSTENQRIMEEAKRKDEELERLKPLAEVGETFISRYERDSEFKELIDSANQKKAEGKPLTKAEQGAVDDAGGAVQAAAIPPRAMNFINTQMAQEEQRALNEQREFVDMITEIEGDKAEDINKFNEIRINPNGERYYVNEVRESIGSTAKALMKMDGLSKRDAYTEAFNRIMKIESKTSSAEYNGLIDGLQSESVNTYGGSKGRSSSYKSDPGVLSERDQMRVDEYGLDPEKLSALKVRRAQIRGQR